MKKNLLPILLIFFLSSCGFTPIYLENTNVDFSIEQVDYTGDRELNNFLKTNLLKYKNVKNNNKIYLEANSVYEKTILSKSKTGEVSNYQMKAEVVFIIKPSNKKIKITEKKIIDSISDKFEETSYERSIKQNFASSITNKLTSELVIN